MSNSFATPRTVAHQAPPFVGFPRQEYWSMLPFSPLSDRPNPGIEPVSPALAGRFLTTELPGKPLAGFLKGVIKQAVVPQGRDTQGKV